MRFQTALKFKVLVGVPLTDKPFKLTSWLWYRTDVLHDQNMIVVPSGFRTDFLTIPWWARGLYSVARRGRSAAIIHDFCCAPIAKGGQPIPHFCSHIEAAEIFREALLSVGVKPRRAAFLAWCVRVGGPKFNEGEL